MTKQIKLYIAGHKGMVGSACVRKFEKEKEFKLLLPDRQKLDLRNKEAVENFFAAEQPDWVIMAAAKVGGIIANQSFLAEFLLENLEIQNNVIVAAQKNAVKKFCFLGSSCIYPRESAQPIREEYLLSGKLEPSNEAYALAKIAGIKLCSYLRSQYQFPVFSLMPCNLYGTGDNYHPEYSHVFPAMIRKFSLAVKNQETSIEFWGSGSPLREFMHVDDLAEAIYFFMNQKNDFPELLNIGSSQEISIKQLAETIAEESGFKGKITWDKTKPDGMPRKLMDSSKAQKLGWKANISLQEGIRKTLQEFTE